MRILKFGFICLLNLAVLAFFIVNRFDVYPRAYLIWFLLILLSITWYNTKDKKEKNNIFEGLMTISFVAIVVYLMLNYNMAQTEKSEFHFTTGDENQNQSEFHFTADDDINPEITKTEVNKYNNAILIGKWEVLEIEQINDLIPPADSGKILTLNPLSSQGPSYLRDMSIKYISIYYKKELYFMFLFDNENQMLNIYEARSTPDSSYVIFWPFDLFNKISMEFTHNRYARIE